MTTHGADSRQRALAVPFRSPHFAVSEKLILRLSGLRVAKSKENGHADALAQAANPISVEFWYRAFAFLAHLHTLRARVVLQEASQQLLTPAVQPPCPCMVIQAL